MRSKWEDFDAGTPEQERRGAIVLWIWMGVCLLPLLWRWLS